MRLHLICTVHFFVFKGYNKFYSFLIPQIGCKPLVSSFMLNGTKPLLLLSSPALTLSSNHFLEGQSLLLILPLTGLPQSRRMNNEVWFGNDSYHQKPSKGILLFEKLKCIKRRLYVSLFYRYQKKKKINENIFMKFSTRENFSKPEMPEMNLLY